jgi:uncharacterized protein YPO0396
MAPSHEDTFGRDPSDEALDDALDEVRSAFHELVEEFREEQADMPYAILSVLCAEMSVTARMLGYIDEVDKPSAAGLKLELDRLLRGFESTVRQAKKGAEEYIARAKQAIAEAEAEEKPE